MAKILVVDDDQGMREFMEIMLTQEGYDVACADNPVKAISLCRKNAYDLVITDLKMPRIDGIEFLKTIKDQRPETVVILITAYASGETAVNAMKEGAYDYVEKGGNIEELKQIVRQALLKNGLPGETQPAKKESAGEAFCGMIGASREMAKIFATIRKVADTPANILILGESGTGKELVARAIHQNSSRSKMPFMAINSGGIPETLLESELFGYMKGSFTGAYADRPGLFELARGGTVFLDEIGELPIGLQAKLLRVLEDKTFAPLGADRPVRVEVRLVSATNTNLEAACQEGKFRMDLMYRLKSAYVCLPPLRDRRGDIPLLASHFLQKACARHGKNIGGFSAEAMTALARREYPGNIRELAQIVENAALLAAGPAITPADLGANGALPEPQGSASSRSLCTLKENDAAHVRFVLEAAGGNRREAARILGITVRQLQRKLAELKPPEETGRK